MNGLPAAWITLERPVRRQAPRTLLRCELDEDGRIAQIQTILAPRKQDAIDAMPREFNRQRAPDPTRCPRD